MLKSKLLLITKPTLLALSTSLILAGCGGGSSDSAPTGGSGTGNPPPTIQTFVVNATATAGGTISPASQTVEKDKTTTFTLTASTGYKIDSVTGCGGTLSGAVYTTAPITAACTVNAAFSLIPPPATVTATATAGAGGEITPASAEVEEGKAVEFTISAKEGYYIDDVKGCNGVLFDTRFTTAELSSDCQITATFKEVEKRNTLLTHFYLADKGRDSVPFSINNSMDLMEDAELGVVKFIKQYSYGKVEMVPHYEDLMPLNKTEEQYLAESPLGETVTNDALVTLLNNYDLTSYQNVMMMLPEVGMGYPGCAAYLGEETYGTKFGDAKFGLSWYAGNDQSCYDRRFFLHELAHNFGINHSASVMCFDEIDVGADFSDPLYCGSSPSREPLWLPYSDKDIAGGYRGHLNVSWLRKAGWLEEKDVAVHEKGAKNYTLDMVEVKTNGLKGVQIELDQKIHDIESNYWVQYRAEDVVDAQTGEITQLGNFVEVRASFAFMNFGLYEYTMFYRDESTGRVSMNLNSANTEFHDVYRGVRVKLLGKNEIAGVKRANVSIEQSKITLTDNKTSTSNTVTFNNGSDDDVEITRVDLAGRNPDAYALVNDTCSGKTLKKDQSCSVVVNLVGDADAKAYLQFENSDELRPKAVYSLGNGNSVN